MAKGKANYVRNEDVGRMSIQFGKDLYEQIATYAAEHKKPMATVVKCVLLAFPWDDPSVFPVVLKIPKPDIRDRQKLAVWLQEACSELQELLEFAEPVEGVDYMFLDDAE
jgi:hypothetical protein